jgi:HD-like signal output (HDOD) protein/CheY-like chemotaxis protein
MASLLFVDDEPRILQGLSRQLYSMRQEWVMHFAESGPDALALLKESPVDVVISDMMMPKMDGATLLNEVAKRYPETIRLAFSGHADREAVLRLVGPAHQYLSKPCEAEELRSAIARTLRIRQLLSDSQLKRLLSGIRSIPTLPALHAELSGELGKEEPSIERVAQIISKDLGMGTKILQVVNSAFFGLPQPAANLTDAVVYLGLATIRALVLSVQVFSQFDGKLARLFSVDELAEHCWQTGTFARQIAEAEGATMKMDNQCFLAGMLHDVGHLILAAELPERYGNIVRQAKESKRAISEIERAELGATHEQVGAYLLGLWGLPTPVIEAVAFHHEPAACSLPSFSAVTAVHAADIFTWTDESSHPEPLHTRLDENYLASIGLTKRAELWRQRCSLDLDG